MFDWFRKKELKLYPVPKREYVIECSPQEWPEKYEQWKKEVLFPCQNPNSHLFYFVSRIVHQGKFHYLTVSLSPRFATE